MSAFGTFETCPMQGTLPDYRVERKSSKRGPNLVTQSGHYLPLNEHRIFPRG